MQKTRREYEIASLLVEDPDYIVDILEITTSDLIRAFPRKVKRYLDENVPDGEIFEEEDSDG